MLKFVVHARRGVRLLNEAAVCVYSPAFLVIVFYELVVAIKSLDWRLDAVRQDVHDEKLAARKLIHAA